MALGNIVGSNLFNLTLILGVSILISPVIIAATTMIHFYILLITGVLLLGTLFFYKKKILSRSYSIMLFSLYIGYCFFLFYS
ncbi:hypothetical protein DID76_01865 [Candidatus Marinamargulisbacteria bacterium SCGC AG-414-C22]|nr:hypothetical protein DID76_01865 [Candidatus Marinamargulisbacteria bacterium SCGC AG-414-C22]